MKSQFLISVKEHMLTRHSIDFSRLENIEKLDSIDTPDAIVTTNKADLDAAQQFLKSYKSLNKPCLLLIDLLGKNQKTEAPSSGMLMFNGPFKPSHLPRAIAALEEELFHLDIIFTNKKDFIRRFRLVIYFIRFIKIICFAFRFYIGIKQLRIKDKSNDIFI